MYNSIEHILTNCNSLNNDIGFLAPNGTLYPCSSWEHLSKAVEIASKLGQSFYRGVDAEDYLQKLGWVVVRANDVYALVGMRHPETKKRIHLTKEQKEWLLSHYEKMSATKRASVDELFDNDK